MQEKPKEAFNLASLQRLCHQIAKEKGFWDNQDKDFNISEKLMLIVSELGEACESLRKGKRQDNGNWMKDSFEDELADAAIRIFDLAEKMKIDMTWQIYNKLDYNKKREYRHGKKF